LYSLGPLKLDATKIYMHIPVAVSRSVWSLWTLSIHCQSSGCLGSMWSSRACLQSAVIDWNVGQFHRCLTSDSLVVKSFHFVCRIHHCAFMWKTWKWF